MLLSFSIPEMLPMIEAGLRQRGGADVGAERVKRQTIRRIGPRAEKLLAYSPAHHIQPYDLHIWWKSRTPERRHIGTVDGGCKIFALTIWHTSCQSPGNPREAIYRIEGPHGWRDGDSMLFWRPTYSDDCDADKEARADGFEGAKQFFDYFVPNTEERFNAALFKW